MSASFFSTRAGGRRARAGVAAALVGLVSGTLSAGLVAAPAHANAAGTDLVISEVYGGGGNGGATYTNDFVELYNPTNAAISVNGKSLQYRASATTTTPTNVFALPNASVPAGGHYLVQCAGGANGVALPSAADTSACGLNLSGTAGQIYLVDGTAGVAAQTNAAAPWTFAASVIDFVGFGSAAIFEGTGPTPAPSVTRSVTRNAAGADTNSNAADFTFATSMTPTASSATPQPLSATDPADVTTFAAEPITPIALQASGGKTPYSWTVSGLPDGLSETSEGVIGGSPTTTGTSTVSATVTDSATPTPDTKTVEFTITVNAAPERLTIAEIQGTGAETPQGGNIVVTQGVVTARYPSGDGNLAGFFIQTGGEEGVEYNTEGASDAIYVFSGSKTAPALGATVEVRGVAGERFGSTQINSSASANTITVLGTPQPAVVPNDTVPGTDCVLPGTDCLASADLDTAREEFEGELFQPTGDYTVTDSYDGSPFTQSGSRGFAMQGEIGLAAESDIPLMVATDSVDQSDATGLAARAAYNRAHQLILDDGADIDYVSSTFEDSPFPWLTPTHPVRVGAAVTFPKPVVLRSDFGYWRLQPQTKVAAGEDGQDRVAIENTRTNAPEDVLGDTGDLKIATFNMLNYFNTLGENWAASDGSTAGNDSSAFNLDNPRRCSYYTDRGPVPPASGTAARLTNDSCIQDAIDPLTGLRVTLPGPRGAANEANFVRQEDKELEAINAIDADVMSLEEVENSIKLYDAAIDGPDGADRNRDDALSHLVDELNAHWLAGHEGEPNRWAYAVSPRPEALPTVTEQDAIRSAFIYNPSKVDTVGRSQVLVNSAPFRNAREPLAQAFKPIGGGREDAFVVIVNHFKSKGGPTAPNTVNGDNVDTGDGAGFYNGDRKRQAAALVAFADQVSSDKNIDPVFFTGDFNAYSAEDPVQVIEAAGYENLKPSNGETTYSFGGLAGSLDHVFANETALAMVTGEDVWSINSNESVYYEYSRYNANATDLYAVNPFRSSDHNPEIIGIDTGDNTPDPDVDTVQILATNDFHGRLLDDPGSAAAGAASMAGAVKELRSDNPDTIFAAAGDLIGASTFESFIQDDEPTIDALNQAGLEVSSVGNHEFDKGYNDLLTRVMPHASWEYIGANVEFKDTEDGHQAGDPALPETWCETLPNGRVIGFVGAVTENLPTLVSSSAIEDVVVTDIVDAVNRNADELKGPGGCGADGPADLVVELVHEGAASTSYTAVTDESTFGWIVSGANENVDAIVSGHTHLAYNHKVPVQQWIDEEREVTKRPVVSAGQYGANLNRLQFEFAPGGGDLLNIRQTVLQLKDYDADDATQAIVDDAVAFAEVQGNVVLGDIEDEFVRARRVGDDSQIVENRGGESTLGNLVAEMQRWRTGADIGFMNPGGLRADLLGLDGTPREVTYRQAANAQPFANTLVTMDLSGAEIKTVLEQQWQRDADGNIPSRPFLRLGTSGGFQSTYDAARAEGDRITGMWLDGDAIDLDETYRVSTTSFLAGAGDNFWGFASGTNQQDTGKTDLEAVVDYLAATAPHGGDEPLPVDYGQHAVGIHFVGTPPATYVEGDTVAFNVSSLSMTGVDDVQDTQLDVFFDGELVDTVPVTSVLANSLFDEVGTASVSYLLPALADGTSELTLRGVQTGTSVTVPIKTSDGLQDAEVTGTDLSYDYGQTGMLQIAVNPAVATGAVSVYDGDSFLGTATLSGGLGELALNTLEVGERQLRLVYPGDPGHSGDTGSVTVTVTKAASEVAATPTPASVEKNAGTSSVAVTVSASGVDPEGQVTASIDGVVVDTATLSAGAATLVVGPFSSAGTKTITVDYLGDAITRPGTTTTTVTVEEPPAPVTTATTATADPMAYGSTGSVSVNVTSAKPTTGGIQLLDGTTVLATGTPTAGGAATLTIPAGALPVGSHTLTVRYLGDAATAPSSGEVTVVVGRADSTTHVSVTPAQVVVRQGLTTVAVSVSAAGFTPTGTVEIHVDGVRATTRVLTDGSALVELPAFSTVGDRVISVKYAGDENALASESAAGSVRVVKATPTMTVNQKQDEVVVDKTRVKLEVDLSAAGQLVSGDVKIEWDGRTMTDTLKKETADFHLPKFDTTGAHSVRVTYLGSDLAERVVRTFVITVVKDKS